MKKQQKSILVLAVMAFFMSTTLSLPGSVGAEEKEPTAATSPTKHSLDEIYNELQALRNLIKIAHGKRFLDMKNGTVLDINTSLIWLKDASCFGSLDWQAATRAAATLAGGAHGLTDGSVAGDWRLPTNEELKAFIDQNYKNPALCNTKGDGKWSEGDAFHDVQSHGYWSSSECDRHATHAWVVLMTHGTVYHGKKSFEYYAWPVRSGN